MTDSSNLLTALAGNGPPIFAVDIPIVYEDEGQERMGDTLFHYTTEAILYFGIMSHLEGRQGFQALPNMNLYYHPIDRSAYVSPDVMVVQPFQPVPEDLRTYRIGEQGPAPLLTIEVLSRRTFQQGDLTIKPQIYADMGVAEYILVDVTADFLPERLQIRRLDPDKLWTMDRDRDGGVTSVLGFRILIEADDKVRVLNAQTGHGYARPHEAESAAKALRESLRRIEELEAQLANFKNGPPKSGN
jgi:Uma2 family endonuclease